jgi:hypothetical protein
MTEKVFLTANVFGKLIPTQASIKAIWDEIQDEESMMAFLTVSNIWAITQRKLSDPETYLNNCKDFELEALSLSLQRMKILRLEFEISGFLNFDLFAQSEAIKSWHRAVRSNFTGGDPQGDRKRLRSIFKMVSAAKEFNSFELPPFEFIDESLLGYRDSPNMLGYSLAQEYSLAVNYEMLSLEVLSHHFKINEVINKLTQERWKLSKKLFKIAEQEKGVYLFQCPYCRKRSVVNQGKTPAHCKKDPQCETTYKEGLRSYQPQNKRKGAGWEVSFGGKSLSCQSCGEKRKVNSEKKCFKCFAM